MSAVGDLEAGLHAMLNLKPPGVSGTQIKTLTALCVDNVQSESVLIQKIYTHFKKTPGTHKLGVLYVVDSVTRRWIELNKHHGQPINSSAPDGTYAAGVHRVTELLPSLMNDILQSAPPEQKEKIKKLVDIWEKGQTFPMSMIETFKQRLGAPQNGSTTPVGSPPPGPGLPGLPNLATALDNKATTAAPNAILDALANIARQNTTAPAARSGLQAPSNAYNVSTPVNGQAQQLPQPVSQSQAAFPFQGVPAPVNAPAMPYSYPPQAPQAPVMPVTASSQPTGYLGATAGATAMPAPAAAAAAAMDPAFAQQVQLIKALLDQGIPQDQIPKILATMQSAVPPVAGGAGAGVVGASPVASNSQMPPPYGNAWNQPARPDVSRDRPDYNHVGSPDRYHNRSRSRSPQRGWEGRDSPRSRLARGGFSGYGRESPGRGRSAEYHQRSPPNRRDRSMSPRLDRPDPSQKWIDFDRTIPKGTMKVLSRTLFVGGVTIPESELRSLFGQHGLVQTCIVNKDKRHAFVKMLTRKDAIAAKEAMENSQFRTRWGVGFGPRDCSDYSTGVSVIPIDKLTDADRKWMLTAPYGGSGGRPMESGMVVEEPDIEIGAGVSSKAISRRMATDKGGRHGPRSSKSGDDEDAGHGRWRRNNSNGHGHNGRREERREDRGPPNNGQLAAADFGFGITAGPNGMPQFPPGFAFPAPNQ